MKTVVLYKSKTGFTKKYSQWIASKLKAEIFDVSVVKLEDIMTFDVIIFGGGLYASGINGIDMIIKNFYKLKDKKIVVFATGASPLRDEVISEITQKNFTLEQQDVIKFFYLRGGFDYSKLTVIDKILMTLLKLKLKMKKNLTADERGMLASYEKPVDFTREKNIQVIIDYLNS